MWMDGLGQYYIQRLVKLLSSLFSSTSTFPEMRDQALAATMVSGGQIMDRPDIANELMDTARSQKFYTH